MARLIKKYKNRRLYDTETSQYITVDTLRRYVLDGLAFKVEDSVSKEDITNATLLQIFVEMEAGPTAFLSPDMLRQLICLAHHPMNASLKTLMGQMFSAMTKQTQSNPYQEATEVWSKQMRQALNQWKDLFSH